MKLQEIVLIKYREANSKASFRDMSEDTGINLTRLFRLFNGGAMKLEEYEKISLAIERKIEVKSSLREIAERCSLCLPPKKVEELEKFLLRKLAVWNLKHS